jgi:hypothetical protein
LKKNYLKRKRKQDKIRGIGKNAPRSHPMTKSYNERKRRQLNERKNSKVDQQRGSDWQGGTADWEVNEVQD